MSHSQLDRNLAVGLADYARNGVAPHVPSPEVQWEQLRPLASMMALDGWNFARSSEFGAIATKDDRRHTVRILPGLRSANEFGTPVPDFPLSEFQLNKDLPSCLLDRPR
jgi:hypothetical protein